MDLLIVFMGADLRNRRRLNVESPSFTPSVLAQNGSTTPKKSTAISPKAASAAPFLPKSIASRMKSFGLTVWVGVNGMYRVKYFYIPNETRYLQSRLVSGGNQGFRAPRTDDSNYGW